MDDEKLPEPLRGIIVPMVTPLRDRDTLDAAGLERLIEHIISGGVQGLFVLGTSGEAPGLSYRLRRDLITRTCVLVAGRVPLLVGITDTSFVECINIANYAKDKGASALVLSSPYYFPAGQPELLEYLQHLAPELPLPLFLYNIPSHTKLVFEPETVRRAAEIPNVVGLKDSSGKMTIFHQVQGLFRDRPEFSLLIGIEELLGEAVLLGGHGGVCGGANLYPELHVKLYEAALHKDMESLAQLHDTVMRISTTIYTVGHHGSSFLKGLKCALSCMDICDDFMAEPFHRFRKPEREQILEHLKTLGLIPDSGT